MALTTDKNDPQLHEAQENGQNKTYLILSDEEKAKGFVRPVRVSYKHVGKDIDITNMEELSQEDIDSGKGEIYVGYVRYNDPDSPLVGRYVRHEDLKKGCGSITTMNQQIAETYARDPQFYGSTFCVGCNAHIVVEEFVWVGTNEKVGS